ncbi:MAG: T9SS type A sorting domain-containing protein [Rhodothermales bacterium]
MIVRLRLILTLTLSALILNSAGAQDFVVVASSPADGDSAVALATTVSLEFSQPLDTTARYSTDWPLEFYAMNPTDSLAVDSVYFSSDLRTAYFDVTHTANTDFVWLLTGARNDAGAELCGPFVLNYSTSADLSELTVTGTTQTLVTTKTSFCSGRPYEAALLLDAPRESGGMILRAALSNPASGDYQIENVRSGTYWPAMIMDFNGNGIIEPVKDYLRPEFAAYDVDFDEGPDSIEVSNSSVVDVHLMLGIVGAVDGQEDTSPLGVSIYPNPARDAFTIGYELSAPASVSIEVADLLGRVVRHTAQTMSAPGANEVRIDAGDLAAGAYLLRVKAGARLESQMLFVTR